MMMLWKKSSLFEIAVDAFFCLNIEKWKKILFKNANIFVIGMNSLKNPELNTHKCLTKTFSILSGFTFLASLQKIIMRKLIFCLMVGFYLTEFVAWVLIYKNKETISVAG